MTKQPMAESQFQMWRCVIAIAQADGKIQDEERAYLEKVFASLDRVHGLTDAQKKTFADDMANAKKVSDILPLVTDPAFRATLVDFGQNLAWADNELSADEEAIIKSLRAEQMGKIDLDRLRDDVRRHKSAAKAQHDADLAALKKSTRHSPVLRALDAVIAKLGLN